MSRPKLESARVDLEPKNSRFGTQVDVKVSDGVKLKAKHKRGSGLVSTDVHGKNWKIGYDFIKKISYGQYERKFEGFDLKVKQKIPDFNWSVVPSPEVQVETKIIERADFSDSLELKYDMSTRIASVEEKFKIGKKHECVVTADSAGGLEGASVHWRTKVGRPYVKTLSAKYSRKKGPVMIYTVDPSERLGVKLETALNPKVIKGELTFKPEQAENAEVGLNFQQPFNSTEKPTTGLFIKWKFD